MKWINDTLGNCGYLPRDSVPSAPNDSNFNGDGMKLQDSKRTPSAKLLAIHLRNTRREKYAKTKVTVTKWKNQPKIA
jgi:hypothetical protein